MSEQSWSYMHWGQSNPAQGFQTLGRDYAVLNWGKSQLSFGSKYRVEPPDSIYDANRFSPCLAGHFKEHPLLNQLTSCSWLGDRPYVRVFCRFWGLVGIEGYLDSVTQLGSHSWFDTSGSTVVEMLAQISTFHQPWGFSRVLTGLPLFIIGPTGITFSTRR